MIDAGYIAKLLMGVIENDDKLTAHDAEQFMEYLRNCTDAQVQGVFDKESKAGRRTYAKLAEIELALRGTP